ncbi:MAG: pyridoxine 5'-phosphate synthase [Candidatus Kryptoniota bacterium]
MKLLSVNIDHIATLRQARGEKEPDPVSAAAVVELAGADGIVTHLREDRRHIQDRDVYLLRQTIHTKLDLEMAATPEIVDIALKVVPDLVTLVPEKRQELTTEGGLDVVSQKDYLSKIVERFHRKKIEVSLFVDPVEEQIKAANDVGADFVELHTGEYANSKKGDVAIQLNRLRESAKLAADLGMKVNAGHGLNYRNLPPVAAIPEIGEFSIGHAIISRAVFVGLDMAVREMLTILAGGG